MDEYKKKLIKGYILKALAILSFLMVIIPVIIAAFRSHVLIGIWLIGCLLGVLTITMYSVYDD